MSRTKSKWIKKIKRRIAILGWTKASHKHLVREYEDKKRFKKEENNG
jgi:hypothetical protein